MREYKLVNLNPNLHITRKRDLEESSENLNKYIQEGWILQQVVSPNDIGGALIAVMYKE